MLLVHSWLISLFLSIAFCADFLSLDQTLVNFFYKQTCQNQQFYQHFNINQSFRTHLSSFYQLNIQYFRYCYHLISTSLKIIAKPMKLSSNDQNQTLLLYKNQRYLFVNYCLLFFLYGATVNSLGPLFPYLSQIQQKTQVSYSVLFIFRAGGYLLGCTISKILERKFSYHTYLLIGCLMLSISSLLFTFLPSSIQIKCFLMLVCGWGCAICNMFLHAAILWVYRFGMVDWYLIVAHGVYGVGGLIGPILVLLFGVNSFRVLFIILLAAFINLFRLKSPESNFNSTKQEKESQNNEHCNKKQQLSWLTGILMCPIFMLAVGQQTIYGGWISSYAVMQSFSQKEGATIFSSLFWISITLFRFILASTPFKSSSKLLFLFSFSMVSCLISLLLIHCLNPSFGLYTSAILFGFANSILYALGLSLPQDFDLMVSTSQSSNFILSSAFGEGILAVLAGQLMGVFGPDALFYMLGSMGLFGFLNIILVMSRMKKQKQQLNSTETEMTQLKLMQLKFLHQPSTDTN